MKINSKRIGIELCISGVFLMPYHVRSIFVPPELVAVNFISLVGMLLIVWKYGKQFIKNIGQLAVLICILLMSILFFETEKKNRYSFSYALKCWTTLFAPLLLVYIKTDKKQFEYCLLYFLNCFNGLTYIMFTMLLTDLVTEKGAMNLFAYLSGNSQLTDLVQSTSRYCSLIGHYIPTAHIYLFYYAFNMISDRIRLRKGNQLRTTIIAIIGIALTASKANIFALFILIILFNIKNLKDVIGSLILLVALYYGSLFDMVLKRFLSSELTTGRNSTWVYVISHVAGLFPLVWGHGTGSVFELNRTSGISWASAAFEYPYRQFSYELGVITMIILMTLAFVIPLIFLVHSKHYQLAVVSMILILTLNMYNGIACYLDYFWGYCIYIFMIINISRFYQCKELFKVQTGKRGQESRRKVYSGKNEIKR